MKNYYGYTPIHSNKFKSPTKKKSQEFITPSLPVRSDDSINKELLNLNIHQSESSIDKNKHGIKISDISLNCNINKSSSISDKSNTRDSQGSNTIKKRLELLRSKKPK